MRRQPPTNWWATLALLLSMTSGCAPPERPDTEPRPDTATPAESSAAIRLVLKTSGWPRTSVVIPELRAGPHLTAVSSSGGAWAAARAVSLNHPLGSAETIDPDTTVRLGHHRGTLFIRFEIYVEATDKSGVGPGGGAFDGTGGEILLASAERPDDVKHFVFNLHDAKLEQEVIHVPHAGDYNADPSWGCPWEVAVRRLAERALIQIAIPIAPALGFEPGRGDTFRLGLVRRRPGAAHPVVSWSAIRGPLTTNSPDFGLAAVGGNHAERFEISDLSTRGRRGVMALAGDRPRVGLRGDALPVVVDHLMAQVLSVPDTARPVRARLLVAKRREVARLETPVPAWPATFLLTPPDGRAGDYTFELETGDEPPLRLAAPVSWRPSVLADAADPAACTVTEQSRAVTHPRSVGRQVLILADGSRVTARTSGRSIALRLPTVFQRPGPGYDRFLTSRLRWRIDGGSWGELIPAAEAPEVILASGLPPPSEGADVHTVDVEAVGGEAGVVGFRFSTERFGAVVGVIHSDDVGELLTDVRIDVHRIGESSAAPVRTEYTRNPVNGRFSVVGMEPGIYRLRVTASGWPHADISDVVVSAGGVVDVGLVTLAARPDTSFLSRTAPRLGRSFVVQPGGTFELTQHSIDGRPAGAELVSEFRTVKLERVGSEPAWAGPWPAQRVTYRVPADTPLDMYGLRVAQPMPAPRPPYVQDSPCAVWVAGRLPEKFHLAGVGHMNTAVQETAEYLARVAATAELAGARTLMVANEVNAAYVAGALRPLRIPCLVTAGNHTMVRWDTFFSDRPEAFDDGPMRIVTHHDFPDGPWAEAEALMKARAGATAKVLLCYEGYAPIDLIRNGGVDLIFDGHSGVPHPRRDEFPKGTLHMRAPGQESIRWIPMAPRGIDPSVKSEDDVPVIVVARTGPPPLRAEFASPNDGSAGGQTVRVINETRVMFPAARLRLVLRAGEYQVDGAEIVQSFTSDDGGTRVIDLTLESPPGKTVTVRAEP